MRAPTAPRPGVSPLPPLPLPDFITLLTLILTLDPVLTLCLALILSFTGSHGADLGPRRWDPAAGHAAALVVHAHHRLAALAAAAVLDQAAAHGGLWLRPAHVSFGTHIATRMRQGGRALMIKGLMDDGRDAYRPVPPRSIHAISEGIYS